MATHVLIIGAHQIQHRDTQKIKNKIAMVKSFTGCPVIALALAVRYIGQAGIKQHFI